MACPTANQGREERGERERRWGGRVPDCKPSEEGSNESFSQSQPSVDVFQQPALDPHSDQPLTGSCPRGMQPRAHAAMDFCAQRPWPLVCLRFSLMVVRETHAHYHPLPTPCPTQIYFSNQESSESSSSKAPRGLYFLSDKPQPP